MGTDWFTNHYLSLEGFTVSDFRKVVNICEVVLGEEHRSYKYKNKHSQSLAERDLGNLENSTSAIFEENYGRLQIESELFNVNLLLNPGVPSIPEVPTISIHVNTAAFGKSGSKTTISAGQNLETLLEIISEVGNYLTPSFSFGLAEAGNEEDPYISKEEIEKGQLPRVFWSTIFSERFIERLGRDTILSSPAWRVEELSNGQIMIIATDHMTRPSDEWWEHPTDPWGNRFRAIEEHLGLKEPRRSD
ncbi:hypothetical protein [Haloarchaeobius sp. HME9146]|uniref:hypothetical protein n=1 Tax=Haloarchaeobius sp. HME9146 TaxID=2978732 RepID=UPI0021BE5D86|nr:hypothetical protein [Haloarchaeobius sp. HME9146]MCT9095441.1 hypothetical protein [Haloarchaeobius sp. HME9146]